MTMADRQPKTGVPSPASTKPTKMGPVNTERKVTPPSTDGDERKPKILEDKK